MGIPTVSDRIVQAAARHEKSSRSSRRSLPRTATAFAPARGAKTHCGGWTNFSRAAGIYVVDADLKSYFDTIPHDRLMPQEVAKRVADGRVLSLIEAFLKQGVLDGLREWTPEDGQPPRVR